MATSSTLLTGLFISVLSVTTLSAMAAKQTFKDGPVIHVHGKHTSVKQDLKLNKTAILKVAFDLGEQSEPDKFSRKINGLARFINMHVANGFALKNIQLALIAHGKGSFDLMSNAAHQTRFKRDNPNIELLNSLLKNNVKLYLCGQSAAYNEISNDDLHKGVEMALSAMTAHAVLQNQGYTLNPF
jgi:intracellular sulfur oxidation DsrE/DsrF family protein